MPIPTINETFGCCYVGPDHYEWPQAGSGVRVDQMQLLKALREAFDPSDARWPSKAMAQATIRPLPPELAAADTLRAGDVWQHPGAGRFYVTDDITAAEAKQWPGHFRCYWSMGGNPNAPSGMFPPDAPIVQHMTLVSRLNPSPELASPEPVSAAL